MKSKILLRRKYLLSILVGLIIFSTHLFYFIPKNEKDINLIQLTGKVAHLPEVGVISPSATEVTTDNSFLLRSLKIPSVGINTFVEYVGLTPEGSMDTPKILENVGLFELGTQPGEIGSAVIDGHYGWKNGKPAAFDNLHKLQNGDKIYFSNKQGVVTTFVVHKIKSYNSKADASEIFNSDDNKAHLNLITCEGVWSKEEKSYSDRLVIFSDKE